VTTARGGGTPRGVHARGEARRAAARSLGVQTTHNRRGGGFRA
jgi:hypothetical protein